MMMMMMRTAPGSTFSGDGRSAYTRRAHLDAPRKAGSTGSRRT